MPGGLVHKGHADPGKTKIYYSYRPSNLEDIKEYKHEEQVDSLELWSMICAQVWTKLSRENRELIFHHIITSFVISLCSQHHFYKRYDQQGLLYHNFRLLDECFWNLYGKKRSKAMTKTTALGLRYKGSQLPNDPRDLFLPVVTGTSDYQQYQPSELATKVWKSLYDVAASHKMWEIDNLFSSKFSVIKIERFWDIDPKAQRSSRPTDVFALDEAGALWLQLPKDEQGSNRGIEEFTKCNVTKTQLFKLKDPRFKNYYIFMEILESQRDQKISSSSDAVEFDDDDEHYHSVRIQACASEDDTPLSAISPDAILFNDDDTLGRIGSRILRKLVNEKKSS
jgi:hypothetical protein